MDAVIQVRDLTRRFGDLVAVDHLNLEVQRGEIFGLVGPDGAGKTTTLRLLLGLMAPDEGEAWVAGHNMARGQEEVKGHIGYMAQRFGLYDDLTVDENMDFYAEIFGIPSSWRDTLKSPLLRMTRMEPFRKRTAGRLSGGMRQKLSLMCTLLHRPEILFLDEPTNGVDPVSRREFWTMLYHLVKEGVTVFVTTAYLDEAERCNRVGMLHRGRLICCDSPDGLRQQVAGSCYEAVGADQQEAREYLQKREGVLSVHTFGSALHVIIDPSRVTAQALQEGARAATLQQITPTLEDVFLTLLRTEGNTGAGTN